MTRATTIPDTITLHVPFRVVKRGGRKEMVLPPGASTPRIRLGNTLVKALARAFRWKRMLESGEFATTSELAAHERIAPSYMTRVLRLTLLAPDNVETVLGGQQGVETTLAGLMEPFPAEWNEQRTLICCPPHDRGRADPITGQQHHLGPPDMLLPAVPIADDRCQSRTIRRANEKAEVSSHRVDV